MSSAAADSASQVSRSPSSRPVPGERGVRQRLGGLVARLAGRGELLDGELVPPLEVGAAPQGDPPGARRPGAQRGVADPAGRGPALVDEREHLRLRAVPVVELHGQREHQHAAHRRVVVVEAAQGRAQVVDEVLVDLAVLLGGPHRVAGQGGRRPGDPLGVVVGAGQGHGLDDRLDHRAPLGGPRRGLGERQQQVVALLAGARGVEGVGVEGRRGRARRPRRSRSRAAPRPRRRPPPARPAARAPGRRRASGGPGRRRARPGRGSRGAASPGRGRCGRAPARPGPATPRRSRHPGSARARRPAGRRRAGARCRRRAPARAGRSPRPGPTRRRGRAAAASARGRGRPTRGAPRGWRRAGPRGAGRRRSAPTPGTSPRQPAGRRREPGQLDEEERVAPGAGAPVVDAGRVGVGCRSPRRPGRARRRASSPPSSTVRAPCRARATPRSASAPAGCGRARRVARRATRSPAPRVVTRWVSARRVRVSAQCRSSTTRSTGVSRRPLAHRPGQGVLHGEGALRPDLVGARRPGPARRAARCPSPSSRAYQGHSGGAPSSCEHRPTAVDHRRVGGRGERGVDEPGLAGARVADDEHRAGRARRRRRRAPRSRPPARPPGRPSPSSPGARASGPSRADAGAAGALRRGRRWPRLLGRWDGAAARPGAARRRAPATGAARPPRGHAPPARGRARARRRAARGSRAAPRAPRPADRCAPGPGPAATGCARAAGTGRRPARSRRARRRARPRASRPSAVSSSAVARSSSSAARSASTSGWSPRSA